MPFPPRPQPGPPPEPMEPRRVPFAVDTTRLPPRPERAEFSGAVQEIMGRTPNWMVRWGMSLFFGLTCILLFLSWLIEYPDTIEANIVITGLNPPVGVVARINGHLEKLYVVQGERVTKGAVLALIEGPANADRIFALKKGLEPLRPFLTDPTQFATLDLGAEASLGRLQSAFSTFHSNYIAYQTELKDDYVSQSVETMREQLVQQKRQVDDTKTQANAVEKELQLGAQRYDRMRGLYTRDSISLTELQNEEEKYLAKQRESAAARSRLTDEQISLSKISQAIYDLDHGREQTLRKAQLDLQESLKQLLADIEVWENDFVLRSPIDGKVAFYEFWSDQQFVESGKEVFVIVPDFSPLIGRVPVSQGGIGKIHPGQKVRINLDDYPSKEFGSVLGSVEAISLVPRQGVYQVSVRLDFPLTSTYQKPLEFRQDMTGKASIVTEDIRLIGRIFYELRRVFKSQS